MKLINEKNKENKIIAIKEKAKKIKTIGIKGNEKNKENNEEVKVKYINNKKYELFKYVSILLVIVALLTWIVQISNGTQTDFYRLGLVDFMTMITLGIRLFPDKIVLLILMGGLYELLNLNKGYRTIVEKVSKSLKGLEVLFVIASILLFSVLSAILVEPYVLFIAVPFVISIIIGLKQDKLTAFIATFGAILAGIIGNIYGTNLFGFFTSTDLVSLKVTYGSGVVYRIGLLVVSIIILTVFALLHMKKANKKEVELTTEDLLIENEVAIDGKVAPTAITLIVFALLMLVAYLPWSGFGLNWPVTLKSWFDGLAIGGETVFAYLSGYIPEFGAWDITIAESFVLLLTIVVAKMAKISFSEYINAFGRGFKKMIKPIGLVILIGAVALIPLNIPVLDGIFSKIMPTFNYLLTPVIAFISSIFGVEMTHVWRFGGASMLTNFSSSFNGGILAVIFQSVYGLVQFVAPTSIVLAIGLSYLEIPYTTWLKKSFIYLLGLLLAVVLVVILITQL